MIRSVGNVVIVNLYAKYFALTASASLLLSTALEARAADETAAAAAPPAANAAADTARVRQSPEDAWWTGPLLASSAATLPQGHLYVEPYLYDVLPYARFDSAGHSHAVRHVNDFGSLTYINYGVTDTFTVGMIPRFAYEWADGGQSSQGIGVGDPSVQVQYRLTQFHPGSRVPTISLNLQETLPLGRYDRLQRPSDGFGSGAWTTTLGAYLQSLFWMPNGRILRARLDLSYAMSAAVPLEGRSVYGTAATFLGHANPGDGATVVLAFEYSVTRNWVAACDFWYERDGNTHIRGSEQVSVGSRTSVAADTGTSEQLIFAPAIEYNWSARTGIIFGARVVAAGRNATGSVTPVVAFSHFR